MAQKRKLQIFISSTYTDLREERQAAVEAILTAGHIPAGMELFAAGDESQMNVIKRWIDESDAYLLILGGRYGSIEPRSQKSYIQLEYEYAVGRRKPLFAVVIAEEHLKKKIKKFGAEVIETSNPHKLKDFRDLVLTRMVKFWKDPRDIKLSILETLAEFTSRDDLVGWIPGSEAINAGTLAEEMARLVKENSELREQVVKLSAVASKYNELTFEEMYRLLAAEKLSTYGLFGDSPSEDASSEFNQAFEFIARAFGDSEPGLVHAFWIMGYRFNENNYISGNDKLNLKIVARFEDFGLVKLNEEQTAKMDFTQYFYNLTSLGTQFLLRLRIERNTEEAEKYVRLMREKKWFE